MDIVRPPSRPTTAPVPVPVSELEQDGGRPAERLALWRLHALRAVYLYLAFGLAVTTWPAFVQRDAPLPLWDGVVECMLVALSVLFLVGVRYPTRMLPILLFELAWKATWLTTVALPLWRADRLTAAFGEIAFDLVWVAPVILAMPWRHVVRQYVRPGDRWR